MASENIRTPFGRTKYVIWTDEETAVLLKVVADYKIKKLEAAQDWEAVRAKYEEIEFLSSYITLLGNRIFSSKQTKHKQRWLPFR